MKISIEITADEFKALTQKEPCSEQGSVVEIKIDQENIKEELKKRLSPSYR
mgnify:CR=1 FL=1